MSLVTLNSSGTVGPDLGFRYPFDGEGWLERYGDQEIHQFRGGELIAEQWDISRARDGGAGPEPATPRRPGRGPRGASTTRWCRSATCARDEGIRETTLEKMATLAPIREGGRLTAAVSSQITDGVGGRADRLGAGGRASTGLTPRARIHHMTVVGSDAVLILTGPIPATSRAFERTGLGVDDIDLFECNEAFASVVLAWAKETGAPLEKVNVNGGAMALGHPLGASGARFMTTLLNELERTEGRYGLQTMCEGGGLSNVTILERPVERSAEHGRRPRCRTSSSTTSRSSCRDLDKARADWSDLLGVLSPGHLDQVTEGEGADVQEGVRMRWCTFQNPNPTGVSIQLWTASEPGTWVDKVLDKRGEYVHHVCFLSDDFDRMCTDLRGAGVPLLLDAAEQPRHDAVAEVELRPRRQDPRHAARAGHALPAVRQPLGRPPRQRREPRVRRGAAQALRRLLTRSAALR